MKANYCDECKHFAASKMLAVCLRGHRPRFYVPKNTGDTTYGYKRKCGDYRPSAPACTGKPVTDVRAHVRADEVCNICCGQIGLAGDCFCTDSGEMALTPNT